MRPRNRASPSAAQGQVVGVVHDDEQLLGVSGERQELQDPKSGDQMFVDCLSMGGNLLLDIGPKEDGTIPEEQVTHPPRAGPVDEEAQGSDLRHRCGHSEGVFLWADGVFKRPDDALSVPGFRTKGAGGNQRIEERRPERFGRRRGDTARDPASDETILECHPRPVIHHRPRPGPGFTGHGACGRA